MSKQNKFKNHGTDFTYDAIDWAGVEQETIQDLAWAYAKTSPMDNFCEGKSGHLGVIRMNEALSVKVDRASISKKSVKAMKNEAILRQLLAKEITAEEAVVRMTAVDAEN